MLLLQPIYALLAVLSTFGGGGRDLPRIRDTSYSLTTTWKGAQFYDAFWFWTGDDPTHGRVNYVDEVTAKAQNLTFANGNTFVMRADMKKKVTGSQRGRDSVRLHSKDKYTDGLIVLDLRHMPIGCGTWPAFWTCTTGSWPSGGEIDIIEGVNGQGANTASLHTAEGCSMASTGRGETGNQLSNNCVSENGANQGCNVQDTRAGSFGQAFNANQGGFYVMRRDASRGIAIWFFPRSSNVPNDVKNGASSVSESGLGTPMANFPRSNSCDIASHFNQHEIIFDITLCGDLGNALWSSSSCASKASTCQEWVDNHPNGFKGAYWEVDALSWYRKKG